MHRKIRRTTQYSTVVLPNGNNGALHVSLRDYAPTLAFAKRTLIRYRAFDKKIPKLFDFLHIFLFGHIIPQLAVGDYTSRGCELHNFLTSTPR